MGLVTNIKYNNVTVGVIEGQFAINYNNSEKSVVTEVGTKTLNVQNCLMSGNIVLKSIYSLSVTVSNVTATATNPEYIQEGGSVTLEFKADNGYKMSSTAPTVTGATVTSWTLETVSSTDDTGTLVLSNPTGNVSFTVVGRVQVSQI